MADLSSRLAGSTVFTKLDLRKVYHKVPVHPEDICKTGRQKRKVTTRVRE
jgi:hypothetical protein